MEFQGLGVVIGLRYLLASYSFQWLNNYLIEEQHIHYDLTTVFL